MVNRSRQARLDPTVAKARFEDLWSHHYPELYAFVRRRLDSDEATGDVASETFLIAWRRLDELPEEPRAWLFGVARKQLANVHRGRRRRRALEVKLTAFADLRSAEPETINNPDLDALVAAFQDLRPADRELLGLLVFDELRPKEIAEVLDISPARVSVRLHRAKERLRKEVSQAGHFTTDPKKRAKPGAKGSSSDLRMETR